VSKTTECENCGTELEAIDNPLSDGCITRSKCDECIEREEQKRQKRKRQQRRKELGRRLKQAHYPKHWLLDPTDPPEAIAGFMGLEFPRRQNGLFICGEKGAGKTFAALALGKRWLEREFVDKGRESAEVLFVPLPEMIARQFDDKSLMYRAMDTECLILDDIGAESPNDYVAELVCTLLDKRERCALPTIMTSNVMPTDLMDDGGYDARMMRRITSMCGDGAQVMGYYQQGGLYS
jgi:DNA replication protein DnaC